MVNDLQAFESLSKEEIMRMTGQDDGSIISSGNLSRLTINRAAEDDDGNHRSLEDDPNVLKSEIDDIRKSVVSMSVGQPGRTSTIVKEWLEQPAPEAPAAEAEEESSGDDGGDEEESSE